MKANRKAGPKTIVRELLLALEATESRLADEISGNAAAFRQRHSRVWNSRAIDAATHRTNVKRQANDFLYSDRK